MTTELLTYENNTANPTRAFVRSGVVGNFDVVYAMIKLIRRSITQDQRVEKFVKDFLTANNITSHSKPEDILKLLFSYVTSHVKYINDIAGNVESIKSPLRTLSDKWGDCDDLTILICSFAGVLGFEDTRIALTKYSDTSKTFTHVYPVIYANGKRYVLDASLPNAQFNKEVPFKEIKEINVFYSESVDNLFGYFKNALDEIKQLGSNTLEAIPNVTQFLPVGVFAGTALNAGASVLTGTKELSFNEAASRIGRQLDRIIYDLMHNRLALEIAKSQSAAIASQLSLTHAPSKEIYNSITRRIREKLNFINNFDTYAKNNDLKVTELNEKMRLIFGVGVISFFGYKLYKNYLRG